VLRNYRVLSALTDSICKFEQHNTTHTTHIQTHHKHTNKNKQTNKQTNKQSMASESIEKDDFKSISKQFLCNVGKFRLQDLVRSGSGTSARVVWKCPAALTKSGRDVQLVVVPSVNTDSDSIPQPKSVLSPRKRQSPKLAPAVSAKEALEFIHSQYLELVHSTSVAVNEFVLHTIPSAVNKIAHIVHYEREMKAKAEAKEKATVTTNADDSTAHELSDVPLPRDQNIARRQVMRFLRKPMWKRPMQLMQQFSDIDMSVSIQRLSKQREYELQVLLRFEFVRLQHEIRRSTRNGDTKDGTGESADEKVDPLGSKQIDEIMKLLNTISYIRADALPGSFARYVDTTFVTPFAGLLPHTFLEIFRRLEQPVPTLSSLLRYLPKETIDELNDELTDTESEEEVEEGSTMNESIRAHANGGAVGVAGTIGPSGATPSGAGRKLPGASPMGIFSATPSMTLEEMSRSIEQHRHISKIAPNSASGTESSVIRQRDLRPMAKPKQKSNVAGSLLSSMPRQASSLNHFTVSLTSRKAIFKPAHSTNKLSKSKKKKSSKSKSKHSERSKHRHRRSKSRGKDKVMSTMGDGDGESHDGSNGDKDGHRNILNGDGDGDDDDHGHGHGNDGDDDDDDLFTRAGQDKLKRRTKTTVDDIAPGLLRRLKKRNMQNIEQKAGSFPIIPVLPRSSTMSSTSAVAPSRSTSVTAALQAPVPSMLPSESSSAPMSRSLSLAERLRRRRTSSGAGASSGKL
jgi:hypothetical protein